MNRIVNSKVWNKRTKRVESIAAIHFYDGSTEVATTGQTTVFQQTLDDDVLLMGATGKKDKNGIDILGGHIVHLVDLGLGDLGVYEVEFNDDCAGFVMYNNNEIRYFVDHHSDEEIEVIGNIYENPELLENQK